MEVDVTMKAYDVGLNRHNEVKVVTSTISFTTELGAYNFNKNMQEAHDAIESLRNSVQPLNNLELEAILV